MGSLPKLLASIHLDLSVPNGGAGPPRAGAVTFQVALRPMHMRFIPLAVVSFNACVYPLFAQLTTAQAVLEKYQQALGGADAIQKVLSETRRGEIEATGLKGKATFVFYAKPFKTLQKLTLPDGHEITSGFDGSVSWSISPQGASIDKATPLESDRRDADLQYPLHQPDYFQKFEFAGVTDFEGRRCYWLHGTTHWGKDNNQFYDIRNGLLAGYRFQSDQQSSTSITITRFEDYKSFGGPLVATKVISRTGDSTQTFTFLSVSYEPLADSLFELPQSVKALLR